MNICKIHDSIMKTQKVVPESFPFKYLDNLIEEFSRPQENWATHKRKCCCH